MNTYKYTAIDPQGNRICDSIELASRDLFYLYLQRKHYMLIHVEEITTVTISDPRTTLLRPTHPIVLKETHILQFTQNLLDLVDAKLTLFKALNILYTQEKNKALKEAIGRIIAYLDQGETLSYAFFKSSISFDSVYINLIKASETSGNVSQSLKVLLQYLYRKIHTHNKLTSSLIYPIFVFLLSACILIGVFLFVIPEFEKMLQNLSTHNGISASASILFSVSHFLTNHPFLIFSIIVGVLVTFYFVNFKQRLSYWLETLLLKLPWIQNYLIYSDISRFSYVLTILLKSGIVINEALLQLEGVLSTKAYKDAVLQLIQYIEEGDMFSIALTKTQKFPTHFCVVCKVGEESGMLPAALDKAAEQYNQKLELQIQRSLILFEPAMILFLAILIGMIVYTLFIPILQAIQQFDHF